MMRRRRPIRRSWTTHEAPFWPTGPEWPHPSTSWRNSRKKHAHLDVARERSCTTRDLATACISVSVWSPSLSRIQPSMPGSTAQAPQCGSSSRSACSSVTRTTTAPSSDRWRLPHRCRASRSALPGVPESRAAPTPCASGRAAPTASCCSTQSPSPSGRPRPFGPQAPMGIDCRPKQTETAPLADCSCWGAGRE